MRSPLAGVTVLDMTRNLAGPYCTMTLGDLGARVIKVEQPKIGDDTRHWQPPSWGEESAMFLANNRNKESIELDIDDDEGRRAFTALVSEADVLVESFRGGSMERRALGFDDVKKLNHRIVYCSISAFGAVGPHRERVAYDAIIQAYSGVMSINGEPASPPLRVGASVIDTSTGIWAALGVLAALRMRDATGEAQHVETSLLEAGVAWMGYHAAGYLGDGSVAKQRGSAHPLMAPYERFATADGCIYIAAPNDRFFSRVCKLLLLEHLVEDDRFSSNQARVANREALHTLLQQPLASRTSSDWEELFLAESIPCATVRSIDQVLADPQVAALGLVRRWPHPDIEDLALVDHPISYNGTRSFQQLPPPALGEHTDAILKQVADDERGSA